MEDYKHIYFIGIGGIGMSALARYFNVTGKAVSGYDRTSTVLTDDLIREGIPVHFNDDISFVPHEFLKPESCLVIYTPAIPESHNELGYFKQNNFRLMKRSEVLGKITKARTGIAIAGTHGKTTVSTMVAEILSHSKNSANAFLGGISKNLGSNLLLNTDSNRFVLEADEFDRSFLQLFPQYALITSMDADHLDIYGNYDNLVQSFQAFVRQIQKGGKLILKRGIELDVPGEIDHYTYAIEDSDADFYAKDIKRKGFSYNFSLQTPGSTIEDINLGIYGKVNLENAVAALSISYLLGEEEKILRKGIAEFKGVKRRFDVRIENETKIFIDDYAHHPEEISAFLSSVKEAIPEKELTGIFQPHLYSRTRDFAEGFGRSLSLLDNVILLDIYPAREKPIEGVSSKLIYECLENKGEKIICNKEQIFKIIEERKPNVLVTMGAGDVDQLIDGIEAIMRK